MAVGLRTTSRAISLRDDFPKGPVVTRVGPARVYHYRPILPVGWPRSWAHAGNAAASLALITLPAPQQSRLLPAVGTDR